MSAASQAARASGAPRPVRRARSFRAVAVGVGLLALGFVSLTVFVYRRFIHHEPVAVWHLPEDTLGALRVSVEQGIVYEPLRRHFQPLVQGFSRTQPAEGSTLLRDLEAATGLERMHLREVLVARGATSRDWLIVLGGIFPQRVELGPLGGVLEAHGLGHWAQRGPEGRVLVSPNGHVALGQAADGAFLIGTGEARVAAGLERSRIFESLGLEPGGDGSGGIGRELLRTLSPARAGPLAAAPVAQGPVAQGPVAQGPVDALGMVRRLRGALKLGEPLVLDLRLDLVPGARPEAARGQVARWLAELGRAHGGPAGALASAQVEIAGPAELRVRSEWSVDALGAAVGGVVRLLPDLLGEAR